MIDIFDFLMRLVAFLAALFGGLWALTTYIIERGLVPAAELDLSCEVVGKKSGTLKTSGESNSGDFNIVEITIHIHNKGAAVLIANNIGLIVKYLTREDGLKLYTDERKFGRLQFPHSLGHEITRKKNYQGQRPFKLVPHDTFVQPNVNQKYSFVTVVGADVEFIHVHGEFQYAQKPLKIQTLLLRVSRKIGLIQYSLHHIYQPHTIQKVFTLIPDINKTKKSLLPN